MSYEVHLGTIIDGDYCGQATVKQSMRIYCKDIYQTIEVAKEQLLNYDNKVEIIYIIKRDNEEEIKLSEDKLCTSFSLPNK